MTNTFTAAKSDIKINENVENGKKSSIQVENIGTATSYVRVKLVMNWVSDDDSKTISATPVNITVDYDNTKWFEQGGIYYYKMPVAPKDAATGNVTSNLLKTPITQPEGAPDGYHLEVTVLAESIQAAPSKAVTDSWRVGVDNNGYLTQPTTTP